MTVLNMKTFDDIDALAEDAARTDIEAFALPLDVVGAMEQNGVTEAEIEKIIGPRVRLGAHGARAGMLTTEQSDSAARLAHVVLVAQRVFGSEATAFLWLRSPNAQLGGKTPMDCVSREVGARFVEDVLLRIDHGIAA